MTQAEQLKMILYTALSSSLGLALRAYPPDVVRARLSYVRSTSPELSGLQIRMAPIEMQEREGITIVITKGASKAVKKSARKELEDLFSNE